MILEPSKATVILITPSTPVLCLLSINLSSHVDIIVVGINVEFRVIVISVCRFNNKYETKFIGSVELFVTLCLMLLLLVKNVLQDI